MLSSLGPNSFNCYHCPRIISNSEARKSFRVFPFVQHNIIFFQLPKGATEIHHEVELGVVIGETTKCVSESDAMKYVAGYTLALDMTDRVAQTEAKKKGLSWAIAKGFDNSCPIGDFIDKSLIPDPQKVDLWLKVNGEMKQEGNTSNMMFSVAYLVHWLSHRFTLERGDLILTGTPEGVGPVTSGDVIQCGLNDVTMTFKVER